MRDDRQLRGMKTMRSRDDLVAGLDSFLYCATLVGQPNRQRAHGLTFDWV